jgi:hypothetical protein
MKKIQVLLLAVYITCKFYHFRRRVVDLKGIGLSFMDRNFVSRHRLVADLRELGYESLASIKVRKFLSRKATDSFSRRT